MAAGDGDRAADPYAVLGVPASATGEQIASAYRRLARRLHPDVGADEASAAGFAEVADAYAVLSDPARRRDHDRGRTGRARRPSSGRVRVPVRRPGTDVSAVVRLSLAEALAGTVAEVPVTHGGATRVVRVRVPAGVEDGQTVRVPGHGAAGSGGSPAGDLLVRVAVAPDARFTRSGRDLTTTLAVSWPEAVLGTTVELDAPTGSIRVPVPAGTPSGAVLRVAGAGVRTGEGAGDLLVRVEVDVPTGLSDAAREAAARLAAVLPPPPGRR